MLVHVIASTSRYKQDIDYILVITETVRNVGATLVYDWISAAKIE